MPLCRAAPAVSVQSRTLQGIASPYDVPAPVSDWGAPQHRGTACARSLHSLRFPTHRAFTTHRQTSEGGSE